MRTKLFTFIVAFLFVASNAYAGSLLFNKTPGNYAPPSGWTTVVTQDFEGTCPEHQTCTPAITSTKPHTGSKSIEGTYDSDQDNVRWHLDEGQIGSFSEVYLSFYEWTDATAQFNDEYFLAWFMVTNPFAEIILEGAYWSNGFNQTSSNMYINCQGTSGDCGATYLKFHDPATGAWIQWEIHFRPNTSGQADGFLRVYKDGQLFASKENVVLNATRSFNNAQIQAGGIYTKLVWMTDYPTCTQCSSGPGVGKDFCTGYMGWSGQSFASPVCAPTDPALSSFKRYIDDVIVMKYTGTPDTSDTQPPSATGHAPAVGATQVPVTTTSQTVIVSDDRTYDEGITDTSTIVLTGPNGAWSCTDNLSCTGTSSSYTLLYDNLVLSNDQVVSWTLTATDNAGNVHNSAWSWTVEPASPDTLAITTSSLPAGVVGTPYSQSLASSGGQSPYTYSIGVEPYPDSPYAPSSTFYGISYDFDNRVQEGTGSDLWPTTWAGDNNVYTAWGDGGGWDGTNNVCRTRFGFARLDGTPPAFSFVEISGCKADDTGCSGSFSHDAACDTPYGGTVNQSGVPGSLLAIDNTIYALLHRTTVPVMTIAKTTDFGQSFALLGWDWTKNTDDFYPVGFMNAGMGYTDAPDGYVYLPGYKVGDSTAAMYLARVATDNVETQAAYEYFTGTSESPSWGVWGSATVVAVSYGQLQYIPSLSTYVLSTAGDTMQQIRIYHAPDPWGPWTTIEYNDAWGNFGINEALWPHILPKFTTSTDFWITFSGANGPDGNWDNFNLIQATVDLSAPSTGLPTGLTINRDGLISGIPTAKGTYPFTAIVNDSKSPPGVDNQALSIAITDALPGGQTTVNLSSIIDTYINSGSTGTNYSTETTTRVYQWPDQVPANRSLYRVDISSLPASISISSASLNLYMTSYGSSGGADPMVVQAYRVTGTVPDITTVTWASFAGTLSSPEQSTNVSLVPGVFSFDVTNMMQNAYSEAVTYLYIALDGGTTYGWADTNRRFASVDHPTSAWRPVVTVSYTGLGGGDPPLPSSNAPGKIRNRGKGYFKTWH